MGGDLVMVLVIRGAQNMAFWARTWRLCGHRRPGAPRPTAARGTNPFTLTPKAQAGLRLGDLAERLGGSGRGVVPQEVPPAGSAGISSAMA